MEGTLESLEAGLMESCAGVPWLLSLLTLLFKLLRGVKLPAAADEVPAAEVAPMEIFVPVVRSRQRGMRRRPHVRTARQASAVKLLVRARAQMIYAAKPAVRRESRVAEFRKIFKNYARTQGQTHANFITISK